VTDRRFEGTIVWFAPGQEYGFISCPELYALHSKDTFVSGVDVGSFNVGDDVSFRVIFRKAGAPQAVELMDPDIGDPASDLSLVDEPLASSRTREPTPFEDIIVDYEELATHGYMLHTVGNTGDGKAFPQRGDLVCISYVGMLFSSGVPFDAVERFSFTISVGAVIAGFDKGISEMSVGQEVRLIVHHSHGYGSVGSPATRPVPPWAHLVFNVKLLSIVRPGQLVAHGMPELPLILSLEMPALQGDCSPNGLGTGSVAAYIFGERAAGSRAGVGGGGGAGGRKAALFARCSGGTLSIEAWLLAVGGESGGALLKYGSTLEKEYDTAEQVVCVYGAEGPDGSVHLEPEFFDDVGVTQKAHQRLFQRWFAA